MIIGICDKSECRKSTLANEIIKLTDSRTIHLDSRTPCDENEAKGLY